MVQRNYFPKKENSRNETQEKIYFYLHIYILIIKIFIFDIFVLHFRIIFMIFVPQRLFIHFTCSVVHRYPHCDAYTSLTSYLPLQFTLPSLTKLPQSAHYHHVVSSQWFLQSATRSAVKQAKRARSRFRPCFSICFPRDIDLYAHPRANIYPLSVQLVPRIRGRSCYHETCVFLCDQRITVFEWYVDNVCRLIVRQRRVTLCMSALPDAVFAALRNFEHFYLQFTINILLRYCEITYTKNRLNW